MILLVIVQTLVTQSCQEEIASEPVEVYLSPTNNRSYLGGSLSCLWGFASLCSGVTIGWT